MTSENLSWNPYARAVAGQRLWGEKQDEGFFYKARVVRSEYDWGKTKQPQIPFDDLIIYEAHVRGFTEDKSSRVKNKGTFAGSGKDTVPVEPWGQCGGTDAGV